MIPSMADFHFLQPQWLWLALLVPPIAWLVGRRGSSSRALSRLADPALLPYLLDGTPSGSRGPAVAVVAAGLLAVLALAGPTWNRQSQKLFAEHAAQVVVVSMSPHMLAKDIVPDRLSRVRYKVRELYAANRDGMNGLIAYTGEAFIVAPLTTDAHSVDDLLTALSPDTMPVTGDDPAKAIDMAADLVRHADLRGGSIVLVTDTADRSAVAAAARARAAGARVSVLGVGTVRGGPVPTPDGGFLKDDSGAIALAARDDAALSAVAAAGGGRFVPLADGGTDVATLAGMLHDDGQGKAVDGAQAGAWQDRGPWLLLPLLPLVALAFRRGWMLVLLLACLPWSPSARADGVVDAFRTPDQQAAAALREGDAKRAQALARSPALRGAAAYKAGDFAAAQRALQSGIDTDSQYNLGNALAKQQHYEDALAAYDRALKLDPHNADAAANRAAVADFLKKQNDASKDGKDKQDKKNQQGNKDQQGKNGKDGQQGNGDKNDAGQQDPRNTGDDSKNSSGKDGKDPSQGKDQPPGKDGEKPGDDGKDGKENSASGKDGDKGTEKAQPPQGDAAAKSAAEKAEAERAQEALKEKMDQAMSGKAAAQDAKKDDGKPHDLGALSAGDAASKLPPDVQRALLRVPDDPGGLLRRKFMLEYQRRHGAEPEE
ncbi:VWA domain-containing protein [Luteibacter sp. ME-Dv--P-043b]|uniref:VWA domain-containing protein n=1 Tax=Luteibacter sp. ME-Dv--P-043b TaxID=3040291 RepID=UPI002557A37B|nr:VWA domain-containing protein [Luteibacter sp. ME-Dv--P-043b]